MTQTKSLKKITSSGTAIAFAMLAACSSTKTMENPDMCPADDMNKAIAIDLLAQDFAKATRSDLTIIYLPATNQEKSSRYEVTYHPQEKYPEDEVNQIMRKFEKVIQSKNDQCQYPVTKIRAADFAEVLTDYSIAVMEERLATLKETARNLKATNPRIQMQ